MPLKLYIITRRVSVNKSINAMENIFYTESPCENDI